MFSSFLFEALKSEDLNRSLWRTVGVSVLRKFYGFHCLRLQELQKMVQNAEFVDVMQEGVGVTTTQIEYKVIVVGAHIPVIVVGAFPGSGESREKKRGRCASVV